MITGIVCGLIFTGFFIYIGIAQYFDENPTNNRMFFPEDLISFVLAGVSACLFFGFQVGVAYKILKKGRKEGKTGRESLTQRIQGALIDV